MNGVYVRGHETVKLRGYELIDEERRPLPRKNTGKKARKTPRRANPADHSGRREHEKTGPRRRDGTRLQRRRNAIMRDLELRLAQLPEISPNLDLIAHLYGHLWAFKYAHEGDLRVLINSFSECYCQNEKEPSYGQKQVNNLMRRRLVLWRALKAKIIELEQKPEREDFKRHLQVHLGELESASVERLRWTIKQIAACGCQDYIRLDIIKPHFWNRKLKQLVRIRDELVAEFRLQLGKLDHVPENAHLIRHIRGHIGDLRLATKGELMFEIEKVERCPCHVPLPKKYKNLNKSPPKRLDFKWKKILHQRNRLVVDLLAQIEELKHKHVPENDPIIKHLQKHIRALLLAKPGQMPDVIAEVLFCFCQAVVAAGDHEFKDWEENWEENNEFKDWEENWEEKNEFIDWEENPFGEEEYLASLVDWEENEIGPAYSGKREEEQYQEESWASFSTAWEDQESSGVPPIPSAEEEENLGLSSPATIQEKERPGVSSFDIPEETAYDTSTTGQLPATSAGATRASDANLVTETTHRRRDVHVEKMDSVTRFVKDINIEKEVINEKIDSLVDKLVKDAIAAKMQDSKEKSRMHETDMAREKSKADFELLQRERQELAKEREALKKEREQLNKDLDTHRSNKEAFARDIKDVQQVLNDIQLVKHDLGVFKDILECMKDACSEKLETRPKQKEEENLHKEQLSLYKEIPAYQKEIISKEAQDKQKLQEYEKLIQGKTQTRKALHSAKERLHEKLNGETEILRDRPGMEVRDHPDLKRKLADRLEATCPPTRPAKVKSEDEESNNKDIWDEIQNTVDQIGKLRTKYGKRGRRQRRQKKERKS
ncbi:DNA ligase 1-like [Macrobrachium rosenbergii]|uniref:DNA ligase 1-like n=1 Tax=Macrobrachium rosenbergii TaxID=79674 RepID=UPI0034D43E6A